MVRDRSVAKLLAPVNLQLSVLVVVLTGLGIIGTALTRQTVDQLTTEISPAAVANAAVQRDMLVLQSGTQAWVQSGQPVVLRPYRIGAAELEANLERLAGYAVPGSELDGLLTVQAEAIADWRAHSEARIAEPGGLKTYDPFEAANSERLFRIFEQAHSRSSAAFDRQVDSAQRKARALLGATLGGMVVAGLAGLIVLRRTRRRLLGALVHPLRDLEDVAHRLADNEVTARAEPVGPREVQAVATALNNLAAAHERALAVEERLRADQRALDSAKGDFVSNVSHELRTPLATLHGYLEIVSDEFDGRLAPHHQKMLDAGQRNVDRLRSLIEDLLTLSRSETHVPAREVIDAEQLVTEVVDDLRVTAAGRGIRIVMQCHTAGSPWIVGDRSELARALLNLVGNAVKFSHTGGLVEVDLERQEDRLSVEITDHGLGIPAGELDRLGTRFFRASNAVSAEVGGTGLGLRIAQSIIDAHEGDLRIRSTEGVGTTVTVRLCLLAADADSKDLAC